MVHIVQTLGSYRIMKSTRDADQLPLHLLRGEPLNSTQEPESFIVTNYWRKKIEEYIMKKGEWLEPFLCSSCHFHRCIAVDEVPQTILPAYFSRLRSAPNDNKGELNATETCSKPERRPAADICFLAAPWREGFVGSSRTWTFSCFNFCKHVS